MSRRPAPDCDHANTVIRAKQTAGGLVARSQCKDCGHHGKGGGQAISKAELWRRGVRSIADLPPYDEAAFERACIRARDARDEEYFGRKLELLIERDPGIAANDPHYSSEKWARLRALVIERAGGLCEGCGVAPATQAHHLHYRTFGNEFLWDLRAVCRACHERVHGIQRERQDAEINHVKQRLQGAKP
jgi:hypothetical protein